MPAVRQNVENAVDDEALLKRYVHDRDPEAFDELARRHAGLVYTTCLRITADRHDAEELTQDCFFHLTRNAASVRSSVAGWLHRLATHRALNAVRTRARRRAREAAAGSARPLEAALVDPTWREVEPILDGAVDALPDELREAIVLHFLQSVPQTEVAARLGVHQSTVSRRIAEGLRRLQVRLRSAGVVLSAGPLGEMIAAQANPGGSLDLGTTIGKMATAGLAGGIGIGWAKLKAWTMFGAMFTAPFVLQFFVQQWYVLAITLVMWAWFIRRRPAFIQEIALAQGAKGFDDPYSPWTRWTWTTPPEGWRRAILGAIAGALTFLFMAWGFSLSRLSAPGVIANLLAYSMLLGSTAVRIGVRVYRFRLDSPVMEKAPRPLQPISRSQLIQSLLWPPVYMLMTACITVSILKLGRPWPLIWTLSAPMLGCVAASVCQIRRHVERYKATRNSEQADARRSTTEAESSATSLGSVTPGAAGPLILYLSLVVFLTFVTVFGAIHSSVRHDGALGGVYGIQSAMALFFLTFSIPLFGRSRATMRRGRWPSAVVVATLCATFNLGFCLYWLASGG